MAKLELRKRIVECLKAHGGARLYAREIVAWIYENYEEECLQKMEASTAVVQRIDTVKALKNQLVAEIGSRAKHLQKKNPEIKVTEGRPRKYYFSEATDYEELAETQRADNAKKTAGVIREKDLYPLLGAYMKSDLSVFTLRIDETKSTNQNGPGGNRWLYPDIVGMEDLVGEWDREVRDCANEYANKNTKLWSFEVKRLINRANVRECFFQTVSNSSWANLAYLVAAEIQGGSTMNELRILAGAHGVGVIELNAEAPSESAITIPARERRDIDWNTANRIAATNPDFMQYIKLIRMFYQTGSVNEAAWNTGNTGNTGDPGKQGSGPLG